MQFCKRKTFIRYILVLALVLSGVYCPAMQTEAFYLGGGISSTEINAPGEWQSDTDEWTVKTTVWTEDISRFVREVKGQFKRAGQQILSKGGAGQCALFAADVPTFCHQIWYSFDMAVRQQPCLCHARIVSYLHQKDGKK